MARTSKESGMTREDLIWNVARAIARAKKSADGRNWVVIDPDYTDFNATRDGVVEIFKTAVAIVDGKADLPS
ncbi:hypothetical protein [Bombella saccharophila]|uniref:Uncharacterized protein n=1 Tax=Bombella saccharophila TaxID=2967338 RepID=A0ABT3W6V3_9PROT|nr:hypothetical protein [Bombella saccharophila]MCX5614418.1 hypothetical protein [Bombella saccharophila]